LKNILLVEPQKGRHYYTSYPPLGLLKLSSYHKQRKDIVKFVQGFSNNGYDPNIIYITSLFTYAFEPVHEVIRYYSANYKKAKIIVGGIYATLCTDHLIETFGKRIEIRKGIQKELDNILPDYSLVPNWQTSILFSSRGCTRKCSFCTVNQLEPDFKALKSIKHLIYPGHTKVTFWDNNVLASPYWKDIFDELKELKLEVDFNQGIDARLLTKEVANRLKKLNIPRVRLAYDTIGVKESLRKAIKLLNESGFDGRRIIVYCLHNFTDSPEDFLNRLKDLMEWGVVVYPMRYEPPEPRKKNTYVGLNWSAEQLEMIAQARRVIGYGGAFPPYEGLKKKFINAKNFERAFALRQKRI